MWRRVATLACLAILAAVSLPVATVEASCTASAIGVAAPRVWFGEAITVAWVVEPACDVIEAGLLLGKEATALSLVGEVFYGFREFYWQLIPIAESGQYWVAAYVRDEDGNIIQSPPSPVQILVPVQPFNTPLGSHGAPASFTGTDMDFLQPAGEPHFASLRKVTFMESGIDTANAIPFHLDGSRLVASTRRTEVSAELRASITIGEFAFPVSAQSLDAALAAWDLFFARSFPRTGLYSVFCAIGTSIPPTTLPAGCGASLPLVGHQDSVHIFQFGGFAFRNTRSTRSSLTYFIPKAPAGRQVQSARLSVRALVGGNPSSLRLSGKPPITVSVVSCLPSPVLCTVIASWDFTEEARQVSAQGGGELVLTPNPVAPVVQQGPGFSFSTGTWSFSPAVNYPWQHGGPDNALVISFGEPCANEITLALSSQNVRPQLWSFDKFGRPIRFLNRQETMSVVTAHVRRCPLQAGSIAVEFTVTAPNESSAEAGGHAHDGDSLRPRTTGTFTQPPDFEGNGQRRTSCSAILDPQGRGSCSVTYFSSQVSGIETISAIDTGFPRVAAEAKIRMEIAGLIELPENPTRYVLVGTPNNHSGTNDPCRFPPPTSRHFSNHFGNENLVKAVERIADAIRTHKDTSGILIRVNDMSLQMGGLFDFRNNWRTPHLGHRDGRHADIEFGGVQGGRCVQIPTGILGGTIENITGEIPVTEYERNHFHAIVR